MSMTTTALLILGIIVVVFLYKKIGGNGLVLILIAILVVLGALWAGIHSFTVLSKRNQVATVHCSTIANVPHTMAVSMDGKSYQLEGDRWMLQSSIVEFQDWTLFLGIKAGYTLDRLNSQYNDDKSHSQKPIELGGYSLYKNFPLWRYIPLIKSAYGNGVILPCDGRTYTVFADPNGSMFAQRS
jgi:hypothetical protein